MAGETGHVLWHGGAAGWAAVDHGPDAGDVDLLERYFWLRISVPEVRSGGGGGFYFWGHGEYVGHVTDGPVCVGRAGGDR